MINFGVFLRDAREELPDTTLARWASIFFSASVLTFLVSLAASQAFLAAASVAYALHLLRHGWGAKTLSCTFPPLKLPLALFCLFTVIPVFWAANPTVGWFTVRKLVVLLIWLLAANLILSTRHLTMLYQGLFLESAVAGLVGVSQFVILYRRLRLQHPGRVYAYMTMERIHGFMGHWMNFGGQQMLIFAVLISFLLLSSKIGSALGATGTEGFAMGLGWLALAVVAISIVLNLGRGVWLGTLAATVYLVGRAKPRWLWALPVLLIAGYLAAPSLLRQRLATFRHPTADPSIAMRFEMWQVALRMIQKHPLVGVGPNNVEQVYTLYLPPGKPPAAGYHEHFHNNFLQLAAERGLPCLAAWIWLMVALCWHSLRIRRQVAREQSWIVEGAFAAWLAFIVEGCFEFNFGTSPVLMLFLFVTSTPFIMEQVGAKTRDGSSPRSSSPRSVDRVCHG